MSFSEGGGEGVGGKRVEVLSYLPFIPNITTVLNMFNYFTFGTAEEGIIKHLSNGEKSWM